MNDQKNIEQGFAWERTFFGFDSNNPGKPQYVDWDVAFMRAIGNQNQLRWIPKFPRPQTLGGELFSCVKSYLPPDKQADLELFCCLGTALDRYYGIDGFFRLDDTYVTFDLSTANKKEALKANLLLSRGKCQSFKMWRIAQQIAENLQKP